MLFIKSLLVGLMCSGNLGTKKAAHRQRETGAAVDNMNGCRSMYQKKGIKKPFKLSLNGDKPFLSRLILDLSNSLRHNNIRP